MTRKSGCGFGLILAIVLLFAAGAVVLFHRSNMWPRTAMMPSAQVPPANR